MNLLKSLSVLTLGVTAACSLPGETSEPTVAATSEDRIFATNLIYKKLETPIAVPTSTPIGQRMSEVLARETAGATSTTTTGEGCEFNDYVRAGITVESVKCDDSWLIRVYGGGTSPLRSYSAWNGRQVVGSYHEYADPSSSLWTLWADDRNEDGKVDEVDEPISRIAGFTLTGYDARGWSTDKTWFRLLFDTDHDGKFDVEGVTGNWTCTAVDGTPGCDSGPRP